MQVPELCMRVVGCLRATESGKFGQRQQGLPQQPQTVESISGLTYIRKRISLTIFVKMAERLSQRFLSDATYSVYRAVTFFNKINLHPYNSYYLRNTIKLIYRSSSIIDKLLGLIYAPIIILQLNLAASSKFV